MALLDGKVAIVTGAGHGIGRAHALELAKHGASVVVNDLGTSVTGDGADEKAADLTVELITQRGGTAVASYDDVSDYDGAGRMVQQAIDTYGQLDVLVNNAGIVRDGAIWNMSEADFDAVIKVHVKGTWAPSHHAARHWRDRAKAGEVFTGRVINTTSGAGPGRQLRPDELRHRQGRHRRDDPDPVARALQARRHRERGRPGRRHPHHRHHAGRAGGDRARGRARGRVEPHGPGGVVTAGGVAGVSDESQHITGQVIRAVAEDIVWMEGWSEGPTINNGGKRWDATKLGQQLATDVFKTEPPPACGTSADGRTAIASVSGSARARRARRGPRRRRRSGRWRRTRRPRRHGSSICSSRMRWWSSSVRTSRSCSTSPITGGSSDDVGGRRWRLRVRERGQQRPQRGDRVLVPRLARDEQVGLHTIGERHGHERRPLPSSARRLRTTLG